MEAVGGDSSQLLSLRFMRDGNPGLGGRQKEGLLELAQFLVHLGREIKKKRAFIVTIRKQEERVETTSMEYDSTKYKKAISE